MSSELFEDLETNLGAPVVKERKRVVPSKPAKPQGEKWFTIILEENDSIPPTGQFFQANGRAFVLRPGEKVSVPECIISILNDAVMSIPIVDASQTVIGYRDRLRFPYRAFGETEE